MIYDGRHLRDECRRHRVEFLSIEPAVVIAFRLLEALPCYEQRQNLQGHPIEFRRLHKGEFAVTIDTWRAQGSLIHCVTALARRCEPRPLEARSA